MNAKISGIKTVDTWLALCVGFGVSLLELATYTC
jgi:hypothetical protein